MRDDVSQLDEISMSDREIYYTPEVQIWLSDKTVKKHYRKKLFNTIDKLVEDIKEAKRPRVGKIKIIEKCQVPIFYLRLSNAGKTQRLLFDYKFDPRADGGVKKVKIWLLAIANKKDVQTKLARSADHKVHSTSLSRLDWFPEGDEEGRDLSDITSKELLEYKERCKARFENLSKDQKKNGWTETVFKDRIKRAATWHLRFPAGGVNLDDEDYDLPKTLRLQGHQQELFKNRNRYFLLEGVAGTGKTTILVYKFVSDVKLMFRKDLDVENEAVFITLNDILRDEIRDLISVFFTPKQQEIVEKCIISYHDFLHKYIPQSDIKKFEDKDRLTREKFREIIDDSKMDKDLIWEEYRGLLRGYNLHSDEWIISSSEYENEGKKRGRVTKEQRKRVYELIYNSRDELENKLWDHVDLDRRLLSQINDKPSIRKLRLLYVDEVQDFTAADIDLMLLMVNQSAGVERIAMAGDLSQSVYPSSFTWPSLSELIFKRHGVKAQKGSVLKENYRSTPYLVDAANIILEEQGQYDVLNSSPSLQRPFSGENTGEPVLVMMKDNENDLMDEMIKKGLPNAFCLLLVRDDSQKTQIINYYNSKNTEETPTEELIPFIETISEYKGAEMKSILLWQPTKGTDSLLDRISDEKRGEYVKENDETVKNSILFELRHLFVGITRARYLLGILTTESNYLRKKCENKVFSLVEENIFEKLGFFFEGNLTQEDHLEQARNFSRAKKYSMAAQSYRNAGREHEFHYHMALFHQKEGKLDKAVLRFDDAIKSPGMYSEKSKENIGKISDEAIEQGKKNKTRGIKSKVLINAGKYLDDEKLAFLEAEISYEEENFVRAAILYHKANRDNDFSNCVARVDVNEKLNIAFQTQVAELARNSITEILSGKKNFIIDCLLGTDKGEKIIENILTNFEDSEFKKSVLSYYQNNPDFILAKSIANTIKNQRQRKKRLSQIAILEIDILLKHIDDASDEGRKEYEYKIVSLFNDLDNPASMLKYIEDIEWKHQEEDYLLTQYHKSHSKTEDFVLYLMHLIKQEKRSTLVTEVSVEIAEKFRNSGKKNRRNPSLVVRELQNQEKFANLIPDHKGCLEYLLKMKDSEIIQEIYKTSILIKILQNEDILSLKTQIDNALTDSRITNSLRNFLILVTNLILGINIDKQKFGTVTIYKNVLKLLTNVVQQGSTDTMMLLALVPDLWHDEECLETMSNDIKSHTDKIKFNEETMSNRRKKMSYAETFFSVNGNTPRGYIDLPTKFRISDPIFVKSLYNGLKTKGYIEGTRLTKIPLINLSKIYSKISSEDKWILKKLREKKFSILMEHYDKSVIENNSKFRKDFAYFKHEEFGKKRFLIDYDEETTKTEVLDERHTTTDEKIITEITIGEIEEIHSDFDLEMNEEIESKAPEKTENIEILNQDSNVETSESEENDEKIEDLEELLDLSVEVSNVREEVLISNDLYVELAGTENWKKGLFNPVIKEYVSELLSKVNSALEKTQTIRTIVRELAMVESSDNFPNHFKALLSIRLFEYKGFKDEDGNIERTYGKELHRNMLKEMFDSGKSEIRTMDREEYPRYAPTILTSTVDFYSD